MILRTKQWLGAQTAPSQHLNHTDIFQFGFQGTACNMQNLLKMSAIWSQGQWVKISILAHLSKTQHEYLWDTSIRTGRSCQCDDPASTSLPVAPQAVTSTTHGATSDNIVVTPTDPSTVCMYMSRINRNNDDQYSFGINTRTERCCQCDDPASTGGMLAVQVSMHLL